jgi:hypothetical protein
MKKLKVISWSLVVVFISWWAGALKPGPAPEGVQIELNTDPQILRGSTKLLSLKWKGIEGRRYEVQASQDLKTWEAIEIVDYFGGNEDDIVVCDLSEKYRRNSFYSFRIECFILEQADLEKIARENPQLAETLQTSASEPVEEAQLGGTQSLNTKIEESDQSKLKKQKGWWRNFKRNKQAARR